MGGKEYAAALILVVLASVSWGFLLALTVFEIGGRR